MFLHDRRLPQLLRPEHYHSQAQHAREASGLFEPSWHPVATTSELNSEGSFITTTIGDHPVVVWNAGGQLRAFLNVCAHRFSLITGQTSGCSHVLKCQYHGWEYDADGHTGRIPEAGGFRPMETGGLCLKKFRVDTCGQMVFVSIAGETSLQDYLGDSFATLQNLFSDRHKVLTRITADIRANWKVVVENAVESYHLEAVHVKTFRQNPPAQLCHHELQSNGSRFTTNAAPASRIQRGADAVMYGLLGLVQDTAYQHQLIYPSIMAGKAGMFSWCHFVKPTGPQQCQNQIWTFAEVGRRDPLAQLVSTIACHAARRFSITAMREDIGAAENVQRGLVSPLVPMTGCLSPREERVWHLQQYVASRTLGHECSATAPRAASTDDITSHTDAA